ncbi:restriction endonuclease subunit S [Flavobacterium sp. Arc2]|uniref:restriction endonuclease subunit S n=1 Tax=Flavobacterium sp. Arc2 TaxID=3046685 RepID=UPI00352F156D
MSKVMTLMNELIELISMGPFGSDIKVDNFISDGVPVLNGSNVSSIKLIETSFKYVSPEKAKALKKANAKRGDIVITHRGTVGQISYIPEDSMYDNYVISQSQFRVSLKRDLVDPIYFTYYFHTDEGQKRLLSFKSHVGVPALAQATTNFRLLEFPLIPLIEQKKIAKVLSDLDSKIELNIRINSELEAMAKMLYDYWFVQFDFPDANGKPYKTAGGKMVWNAELKREIPEGWEVKLYAEWINNDKSGDWGKEQPEGNYTEKVYCIRGADINGLNGTGQLKSPERYILEKNLHKTLDPADLVVEISGGSPTQSTGRLAFITEGTLTRFDAPIICSNFCKAVTLKNKKLLYNFVYHWKSIYDAGVLFGYEGKTSGIKNLLFDSFVCSHFTVVPEESIANKFYDFMEPIQTQKQKNLKENQELASLRDWLLPMLMNGQVSVGDVEEELGMVAEGREEYKKE